MILVIVALTFHVFRRHALGIYLFFILSSFALNIHVLSPTDGQVNLKVDGKQWDIPEDVTKILPLSPGPVSKTKM
jgi:hypothetical protein